MNRKYLIFGIFAVFFLILAGVAWNYLGLDRKTSTPGEKVVLDEREKVSPEDQTGAVAEKEWVTETVAEGLVVPWSLAFTAENRMLVTERPGRVRAIVDGELLEKPLYTFKDVSSTGEEGLMGLAIDPHYAENRYLYVSYAYGSPLRVKVVRLKDEGEALSEPTVILDKIPAAQYHAGSRLKFGPDKALYITTGDATDKALAQNMQSLAGKILRINTDGSIPEDNPDPASLVYSYGHRNPQGIAWDPYSGEMYATEHGPSVFDGPAGGDEVNHIMPGANYGWPLVSHEKKLDGTEEPLLLFTPAIAPSGATFYSSDKIPQFTGKFFWTALKGEGVFMGTVDVEDPDDFDDYEKLPNLDYGRIRDIVEGPDGALYFLTSNRDGRGKPQAGDDKVIRLRTKE
ncbi:MAG: hypothetical protein A2808_03030 [Candidatus Moranbacteria bacterium RIFCSPHIGHO2_01_FULL_55_24]|nr:MAG: hypothetical protein A2808_03030 [Candidatus Moranbacteria bacterium RIFCSPHIGHO2_01_FULL_55_24]